MHDGTLLLLVEEPGRPDCHRVAVEGDALADGLPTGGKWQRDAGWFVRSVWLVKPERIWAVGVIAWR